MKTIVFAIIATLFAFNAYACGGDSGGGSGGSGGGVAAAAPAPAPAPSPAPAPAPSVGVGAPAASGVDGGGVGKAYDATGRYFPDCNGFLDWLQGKCR